MSKPTIIINARPEILQINAAVKTKELFLSVSLQHLLRLSTFLVQPLFKLLFPP